MSENPRPVQAKHTINRAVFLAAESGGLLEDAALLHPELAVELNQMVIEMHDLRVRMFEAADRIV